MTKRITNTDLANKIDNVGSRLEKVEDKVQVFHDYMTAQVAVQKDRETGRSTKDIDWVSIIKQFLVFMTLAASVVYLMVEFLVKRASQ